MALIKISEEQFYYYDIDNIPIGVATEIMWFEHKPLNILATIVQDNIDKDWGYVLLAKDEDDIFRFEDLEISLDSSNLAFERLSLKIDELEKNGILENEIYNSDIFDKNSITVITDIDIEVKKYFKKYPNKLYEIEPRRFEDLIASIMKDMGFDIELTKATRDGGRDIIASIKNSVTDMLCYIECKRYAPENKIGVGIVRKVVGVHTLRKPTKSIIVTTSFFTKDAIEEAKIIENQIDLKNFNNLKDWLEMY